MSERGRRIAVVGVGNILMGDEGVGVRVVEAVGKRSLPLDVECFDGGTAFPTLVGQLVRFDKLIVVDAIRGGETPGTTYRLSIEDAQSRGGAALSLHDVGVVETVLLQGLVAKIPKEIVFVGVEPEGIEPSLNLSAAVEARLDELVEMVLRELEKNGVQQGRPNDMECG